MNKKEMLQQIENYTYICKRIDEINKEITTFNQLIEDARTANLSINYGREKVGKTNKIVDTTYDAVERIINLYEVKIKDWKKILEEMLARKQFVESILDKLSNTERTIIEQKYVKKRKWWQVAQLSNYSERQCKRVCYDAIEKLI